MKKMTPPKAGEAAELRERCCNVRSMNLVQPLWTMVWQLLIELNTHVPHEPALYAQVLIQEKRICVHRKTGIRVSVEPLFTIAHN